MDYTIHVEMHILSWGGITELMTGVAGPNYKLSIPFGHALEPHELNQLRLDIEEAFLSTNTKVERIWQAEPPVPGQRVVRRWNLNESEGRYAGTNLVEAVMELHLGMKHKDGRHEPIGKYLLDLEMLAENGFVRRRVVEENRVFDVQIYRIVDGEFTIGVREDHTIPLAQFELKGS